MKTFFRFLISRALWINVLIALLLIAGSVYATLSYLERFTLHGVTIEVPELINEHLTDIDEAAIDGKFELVVTDSAFDKNQKGGCILEQTPPAGFKVKPGRKVYLTISAYTPPEVMMPNLIDLSLRQATSLLLTSGLEVGKLVYKPDICTNCVLEQRVNGEKVKEGDWVTKGDVVDLIIGEGLGNKKIPVPYLIDFTGEMAVEYLRGQYLNVSTMIYDETVKTKEDSLNARVYRQIPHYSERPIMYLGETVELYLTIDTNLIIHSVSPIDTFEVRDTNFSID